MTPPEIDPDDEEALPAPRRPSTRYRPPGFPPEVALLVAGGGDFSDFKQICDALDLAAARSKANTLRHLGRPGCQQLAGRWSLGKPHCWQTLHGGWAEAVALGAVGCVAFPGTDDELIRLCAAAGLPAWRPYG